MAHDDNLGKYEKLLIGAAVDEKWEEVGYARAALVECLLGAIRSGDVDRLKRLEATFNEAHRIISLRQSLSREQLGVQHAWGLFAEAKNAAAALAALPAKPPRLSPSEIPVRDAILFALADAPMRKLSNRDLIRDIGAADETISRALSDLRTQGLTHWWKASRLVMNQLTEKGLAEARSRRSRPMIPLEPIANENIELALDEWSAGSSVITGRFKQRSKKLLDPMQDRIAALTDE